MTTAESPLKIPLVGAERMSRLGLLEEPMGYVDGMDLYKMELDNPINRLDPMGTQAATTTAPATTEPSPITGNHKADMGIFAWTLKALANHAPGADFSLTFSPTKDCAKNISFIQVVLQYTVDGKTVHPDPNHPGAAEDAKYWAQFVTQGGSWVDHVPNENTAPYYGAQWNDQVSRWVTDHRGHVGSGPDGTDASMLDTPNSNGTFVARFETVAVGINDGKIYGGVTWGVEVTPGSMTFVPVYGPDGKVSGGNMVAGGSQIKLIGPDFETTASNEWKAAVGAWNTAAKQHPGWKTFP